MNKRETPKTSLSWGFCSLRLRTLEGAKPNADARSFSLTKNLLGKHELLRRCEFNRHYAFDSAGLQEVRVLPIAANVEHLCLLRAVARSRCPCSKISFSPPEHPMGGFQDDFGIVPMVVTILHYSQIEMTIADRARPSRHRYRHMVAFHKRNTL